MSAQPQHHDPRDYGVNSPLTPTPGQPRSRRRRETVENDAYAQFCRRIIRAAGKRVADGDVEGLKDLLALQEELDTAVARAVLGLRTNYGYSWSDIASRLGISRQAAQQRWGGTTGGDQP